MGGLWAFIMAMAGALMDLLLHTKFPSIKVPSLMVEFPVHPESAPFLVSSPRGTLLWVDSTRHGVIRTAPMTADPSTLNRMVLDAIIDRGKAQQWGNVLLPDQMQESLAYLKYYDFHDVDILCSPEAVEKWNTLTLTPYQRVVPVEWLLPGSSVVVPSDRSYFGFDGTLSDGKTIVLVHNASRGLVYLGE